MRTAKVCQRFFERLLQFAKLFHRRRNAIAFCAPFKPFLIDRLVESAFEASMRTSAGIKSFDDSPRLVTFGDFFQRFFADIADNQIVVVVGREAATAETNPPVVTHGEVE
jgi:hypothetical protein